MISRRNAEAPVAELMPETWGFRNHAARWYQLVSRVFAHKAVSEMIATRAHLNASPEAVWNHIILYEEVPGRPPFLLRALLPHPVRTEGNKTRVGAIVRCSYTGGHLAKRITNVEPPYSLQFKVIEQRLGIEGCILTLGGSYQIYACGDATDVVLITKYQAYLHPRILWRPLEALLVGQLHSHILRSVCGAVLSRNPAPRPVAESFTSPCSSLGGLGCTGLQSCSRR